MNKAQPWNINGVGFDAREAAREAARRQGKSLGEWLHGVIADHADEHDVGPRTLGGQERIDAVTARLEEMGARAGGDTARRSLRPRQEPKQRLRREPEDRDHDDSYYVDDAPSQRGPRSDDRRARHAAPPREENDDLLEAAIAAMERRATRTEQRTSQALASMARLLEETHARREQEFGDVAALTRKLGELETQLSQRFAPAGDSPVKSSLARLEARLDAIGKRGAAEAAARRSAVAASDAADPEPIRRLEGKLDTILQAMQPRHVAATPQASSAAMAAAQAAQSSGRRSLGEAIADISRRQRVLEEPVADTRFAAGAAGSASRRPDAAEALVASLRGEMASLAAKVDDIRRDALLARKAHPAVGDGAIDSLRAELGAMAHALDGLAPRGSIEALETSIAALAERIDRSRDGGIREADLRPVEIAVGDMRHSLRQLDPRQAITGMEEVLRTVADKVDGLSGHDGAGIERLHRQMEDLRETMMAMATRPLPVERIEHQVAALTERVDRALSAGPRSVSADIDAPHLEQLVHELGRRFEAVQASGADNAALDSLQRQVERLSERFERSESGLSTLPTLTASMRDLFAHLEVTRASVESSAAQAAREVLKIAADEGRQHRGSAEAAFRPKEAAVDAHTSATLDTVQDMLGKVVDRLATMEHEIADVRRRPTAARPEPEARLVSPPPVATQARPKAPVRAAGSSPSARPAIGDPREIRLGGMEPRLGPSPLKPPRKAEASRADTTTASEATGEDGRRPDFIAAARRAAATAQAEAAAAQRQTPAGKAARAGLLAKSRDYVATHRRPMLMGIAAIMMAVGAIALMGRIGGLGSGSVGGVDVASAPAQSARVATTGPSGPTRIAAAQTSGVDSGALTPSALPKSQASLSNPIPGSDPIQTGSIPSLPAFAAGPPPRPLPPRPSLPPALVAAAEAGDPAAQYDLATRFSDGRLVPRDTKLAASWFEKAANSALAPAQYRLASLYEKGIGVAVDKARARSLYTKAAEAGNPRAMHNLAVLLADGDGHPDYTNAVAWFRKAAQYGVHDSQYNLAVLLGRGLGAAQNLVQSYQWFAVAGGAGDADAEKKRDEVGQKLSANDLAVAKALAASFQAKVPDQAAVEVAPPPGGWDGVPGATRLNSARSKISSL